MRKTINENPLVQVVIIGVLVVIVGFLFMTRLSGGKKPGSEDPAAATATEGTVAPITADPGAAPADATATDPAAAPDAAVTDPAAAGTAAPAPAPAPVGETGFVAGPGLPEKVVSAYDAGKTVVLLVVRQNGIDDRKVVAALALVGGENNTALFVTRAKGIAKYSRITQGVEVERVPAIVVIRPKKYADGGLPEASVSYGYRGPQSIAQAVRDANYGGRSDLPYYPE